MGWIKKRAAFLSRGVFESDTSVSGLRYRIGIISDAHQLPSDASPYTNGVVHLEAALKNLHALGAQEIISCGDSCINGTEAEWQLYVQTLTSSPFSRSQVHECNGNHDGAAPNLTLFKQYANNGARVGNTPYFSIDLYGDHFIFMALDQTITPSGSEVFSDAQMEWLEAELAEHYGQGKNVWIVEHALFYGWGTGDIISSPKYSNALNMSNANNQRLKELLIAHPDCIMLHGHSHIQLEDRDPYGLVVYAPPGEDSGGCHQFHVPSICAQKELPGLGVNSAVGQSECWFCEVYDNKIVFTGIHAYTGEAIPNMVYTIER